jgi:predicted acylesterase/phospholipase RssA
MAVELRSGEVLVYSNRTHADMKVSEALEIATAMPSEYPPVEREDGRILIDGVLVSAAPVWLPAGFTEKAPIIVLTASSALQAKLPASLKGYIDRCLQAGIDARDDLLIDATPQAHRVRVECGDVQAYQFSIDRGTKVLLIGEGRRAVERKLREVDLFKHKPGYGATHDRSGSVDDVASDQARKTIIQYIIAQNSTVLQIIGDGNRAEAPAPDVARLPQADAV